MEEIIIVSKGSEMSQELIRWLDVLFPECGNKLVARGEEHSEIIITKGDEDVA